MQFKIIKLPLTFFVYSNLFKAFTGVMHVPDILD